MLITAHKLIIAIVLIIFTSIYRLHELLNKLQSLTSDSAETLNETLSSEEQKEPPPKLQTHTEKKAEPQVKETPAEEKEEKAEEPILTLRAESGMYITYCYRISVLLSCGVVGDKDNALVKSLL